MADATARLDRMKGAEAADHALVESAVSQVRGERSPATPHLEPSAPHPK